MAFAPLNFSLLVGANGFALYHYRTTTDNKLAVHGTGYFNSVAGQLNVGDVLIVNASDGNEITAVASITAGVVAVGAGTAVA